MAVASVHPSSSEGGRGERSSPGSVRTREESSGAERESNHRTAVQRERKRESGPKLEFDDRFQFLPVSVDGCSLAQSLTHTGALTDWARRIWGKFPSEK